MPTDETRDLVRRASTGDEDAWRMLVRRYDPTVLAVARAYRLAAADVADVSQNTWLSLARHVGRLRDPCRLCAWLATTARRESLRLIAARRRELAYVDDWSTLGECENDPERHVIRADRDRALWTVFSSLSSRCQQLLGIAVYSPELTQVQIGRELGIAASSVGQLRGRCLTVLRRRLGIIGRCER